MQSSQNHTFPVDNANTIIHSDNYEDSEGKGINYRLKSLGGSGCEEDDDDQIFYRFNGMGWDGDQEGIRRLINIGGCTLCLM